MDKKMWYHDSVSSKQEFVSNKLLVYKLASTVSMSIDRLRHALIHVVGRQASLRTALIYDHDKLIEKLFPMSNARFNMEITYVTSDAHLNALLVDEETNQSLFNINEGKMFRCHLLRYSIFENTEEYLNQNDIVVFNFHPTIATDNAILLFIDNLRIALTRQRSDEGHGKHLLHLDSITYQKVQYLEDAGKYGTTALQSWTYPANQQESPTRTRTHFTATLDLDQSLVDNLAQFMSRFNFTIFQVGLAAFYTFLFKLSNSEHRDLCTNIQVPSKRQYEFSGINNFSVSYLPCQLKIDPYESFSQLCYRVQQLWLDILSHSHLPYHELVKLHLPSETSLTHTIFSIESSINNIIQSLNIDNEIKLERLSHNLLNHNISKSHLICTFHLNQQNQPNYISFNASIDIYNEPTISTMICRFERLLHCILLNPPVYQLSILLTTELQLINDLNNTYVDYGHIGCIHWDIACQAQQHPQKIALVLHDGWITFAELLYNAQHLSQYLITNNDIHLGDVICQIIERSFEMIIGIIAIMMSGCIYTGLSSREPIARLHTYIQQTSAQLILIHRATQHIPLPTCSLLSIDQVISHYEEDNQYFSSLDIVNVTPEHISHIVFTSGSTGIPKAIQIRHRSFVSYIRSFVIQSTDVVLHHSSVTFDAHLEEILGAAMLSGLLVLLPPDDHLDIGVIAKTVSDHQVTYIGMVPSQVNELIGFLQSTNEKNLLKTLHCITSAGETLFTRTVTDILPYLNENYCFYNCYGPTECTELAIIHLITKDDFEHRSLPIGRPMANVRVYLVDEYLQVVIPGIHIGEVIIGGPGVFPGYRGRDDLTKLVLCTINNEICYRTGDLARLNPITCTFEYCGRQDFQVKLRGQRIELGEIESILMEKVSACVVTKTSYENSDYLVAYVVTKMSEYDMRQHCSSRLPLYMVPSFFVILDKLPLNQNGKIDRKALPSVDFSSLSVLSTEGDQLITEMERKVFSIWCEILPHLTSIPSTSTSFFSLGGNSLSLIKVSLLYKQQFKHGHFKIVDFFQRLSIADHAQLLEKNLCDDVVVSDSWISLNISQGPASFAQTRIYLDERVRSSDEEHMAIYNMVYPYEIVNNSSVSLKRLHRALHSINRKHAILRTRVMFDEKETDRLYQTILNTIEIPWQLSALLNTKKNIEDIIRNEESNSSLFNYEKGCVFRCHIIRCTESITDDDLLLSNDIIIFNFHHIAFDGASINIFLRDLCRAYANEDIGICLLNYIDYSVYDRKLDLNESKQFWHSQFNNCTSHRLQLPYDLIPQGTHTRSGRSTNVTFAIDQSIVDKILNYMVEHNVTLFQLGLTAFSCFLYKLTSDKHLCIATVVENRYRPELADIIGFFVNTVPYHIIINPQQTFLQQLQHIKALCIATLPHSHVPYQDILPTNFPIQSFFTVEEIENDQLLTLDNNTFIRPIIRSDNELTTNIFELECSLIRSVDQRSIIISLQGSLHLFDSDTVRTMAQRFERLFNQFFINSPICEHSILSPNELKLINDLNDTYVDYGQIGCIHWEIARQAQQHPQKIALGLQNGSLSYGELLYYTQLLATHLSTNYAIQPGDVICQLMERSFEMVVGMIAILMIGCIYTGLSSREPIARLHTYIQQTSAQLILIHRATQHVPLPSCSVLSIDQVISHYEEDNQYFSSLDIVDVTPEHISHIVFTSGSTGIPKAIQIRHRNFVSYIRSYTIQSTDVTLHHIPITFDAHLGEILGPTIMGGQVVLLPPDGHLDMEVLSKTISDHQVTFIGMVPSQVNELTAFLHNKNEQNILKTLRRLAVGGETLFTRTVTDIMPYLNENCLFYNIYGPAECTELAIIHLITKDDFAYRSVPLGRPMANVRVYLVDEYLQPVIPGIHVGELVIGGRGVFAGYRGRDDLTRQVLCKINSEICYRTGDLARLNPITRLLEYCGRQDYQVKLRGQRIELGEIESIITEIANMCVVTKMTYLNNDYLVAYVETKTNQYDLRQHCSSRLPLYMVPSYFVIVDKLPLNQNGKIDRKGLPLVDFASLFASFSKVENEQAATEMERQVFSIWCEILPHLTSIPSTSTSFFSLGGNSLSLMKVHRLYQKEFKGYHLNIGDLFRRSTIADHAFLLLRSKTGKDLVNSQWNYLNIVEGPASHAQTTVWLAEHIRFIGWPEVSVYNMPSVLQVESGYFSIDKCIKALNEIVAQHWIFRTRLAFDVEQGSLRQIIHPRIHYPVCVSTYKDEIEREIAVNNEVYRPFDTESQGVFRCHFIQKCDHNQKNELSMGDVIIFHFHHGSFDGRAVDLFLEQFKLAYECEQLQAPALQYIDYSIHERNLLMTEARNYWYETLKDYGWDHQLDFGALSTSLLSARRREQGSAIFIKIPLQIARSMIKFTNQLNVTLFQLGLTCFYLFLCQISPDNHDACIGINHLNRYRPELGSSIGMFVNVLPCRIKIESLGSISFIELVKKIQRIFLESVQYSHLLYDQLIDLHRVPNSCVKLPFLQTIFRVDTDTIDYKYMNGIILNNSCHLSNYTLQDQNTGGHFDLELSLMYDKTKETIECQWSYLFDAFEKSTIDAHANCFITLLTQLFELNTDIQLKLPLNKIIIFKKEDRDKPKENNNDIRKYNSSISTISRVKTNQEQELMDRIRNVFCRVLNRAVTDIDVDKSFFEQSGTSLKALQAIILLQQDVSFQFSIEQFFEYPSVTHIAGTILTKTNLS